MSSSQSARQQRSELMANESIPRLIIKMSIPTIIAFLINSIYSLADTYFVSGLGDSATAAVSVNSSLDQLIMMCGSMLAVGANSYIARLLGQGEEKKASQVLSTAFFLAFGLGLTLTVVGSIFMKPMVRLLGATAECEKYAIDYATYVLLAAPLMASSFVMNQCLRSEGSATLSMIGRRRRHSQLCPRSYFYYRLGYGRGGRIPGYSHFQSGQLCHSDLPLYYPAQYAAPVYPQF